MRYDYFCNNCGNTQEEIHGMLQKPVVHCNKCRGLAVKLICGEPQFCGVDGTASMYNFTDFNTTGKPVVINSKTQWKDHLKRNGLNDDVKNDPLTKADIQSMEQSSKRKKEEQRKVIKSSVVDVVRNTPQSKLRERAKKVIRNGG
jgi:predicted nucleic acid-binding Zn ribbon protein